MRTDLIKKLSIMLLAVLPSISFTKEYIIYSIVQEIPMGYPNEVMKKNYYLNMGGEQGLKPGTTLDVYRKITRTDPYESKNKYDYNVKVGQVKVIHSEQQAAIATLAKLEDSAQSPLTEINSLMIGDLITVHVD